MSKEKRRFRFPLLGLLAAFIAAVACNIGTVDPAGEIPALNVAMTAVFIAAWALFFIFFRSKSKAMYIVGLIYWGYLLVCAVPRLVPIPGSELLSLTGTPFALIPMAMNAPIMGLFVSDFAYGHMTLCSVVFCIVCAVFTALSIYKLAKKKKTLTDDKK